MEGRVTTQVKLPPALEKFAEDCVADGRYEDIGAVVNAGMRLLRAREPERLAFVQSLKDAEEEAERDGYFTIDEVVAEMEAIIAEVAAEKEAELSLAK